MFVVTKNRARTWLAHAAAIMKRMNEIMTYPFDCFSGGGKGVGGSRLQCVDCAGGFVPIYCPTTTSHRDQYTPSTSRFSPPLHLTQISDPFPLHVCLSFVKIVARQVKV